MSTKIKSIVEWVQKQVPKVVEWVIGKAKAFSKKVGHKLGQKGEANKDRQGHSGWEDGQIGKEITFGPEGQSHRLWIEVQETSITVMVASKKGPVKVKIERWKKKLEENDQLLGEKRAKAEFLLRSASNRLDIIEKKGQEARKQWRSRMDRKEQEPSNLTAPAPFAKANSEVLQAQQELAQIIKQLLELFVGTIRVGGLKYILDDVLFRKMLLTMNPLVSQTSLMGHYIAHDGKLTYFQNNQPEFGKVIKNEYNRHAEKVFIQDYFPIVVEEATKYHETTKQKSVMFITLNRSSCGKETEHDCTGELVKIITDYKNILNVHIEFAAAYARGSEYSGSGTPKLSEKAKERIEQVIIRLLDAGAFVYATTLWRDILQTEYFQSISSRKDQRQTIKYSIYEKILDDCVQEAKRKWRKGNQEQK
ncbi:MAG: hypothetical protein ACPGWR_21315 [Ardenticatenaceae bacterium]